MKVQRHKARAEAAEKERDLHAEVGLRGVASGKWHGLSTPTPGGLENPQPAGKGQQQFVLRFITAN